MPLGWKVLQSYGDKIISNHQKYLRDNDDYWSLQNTYWTPGVWQYVDGEIMPCRNGLHMSPTPAEAWAYVPGDILALVEGAGTSVNSSDTDNYAKSAHSQMRIIRAVVLPDNVRREAEVKFGRDLESFMIRLDSEPELPELPELTETNAYLRQVFKELPAIKPVQR